MEAGRRRSRTDPKAYNTPRRQTYYMNGKSLPPEFQQVTREVGARQRGGYVSSS